MAASLMKRLPVSTLPLRIVSSLVSLQSGASNQGAVNKCLFSCINKDDPSCLNDLILSSHKIYGYRSGTAGAATPMFTPFRSYGRKVRPKPPKITHFEYSGDLRILPEIAKDTVLFPYRGLENVLEKDEKLKMLCSVNFASQKDVMQHRKEQLRDRMMELFGPDSELEQRIAELTLQIRLMIPYCIQYRTDKGNKIWLLKRIFRRRRLLTKLRQIDSERFEWLLRELKIRYVIPRDREEFKGWKHDKRVATQEAATDLQRKKLEELKAKFEEEKKAFYERKARILKEMEADLEKMGMEKDFLDELQVVEKETLKPHKILTWEERVKLGMTGKIKDYYG